MNLDDISEKYQKNLISFFYDERIIDHIYKEQYGEESYKIHKDEYRKQYEDIMKNTVFMPYVSLRDLARFLLYNKGLYGADYVKENYPEELELYHRLNAKKKNIVAEYTNLLLDELMQATNNKLEIDKSELSKDNFENNVKLIGEKIFLKKGSIIDYFKKKKINNIIEKYKNAFDGKMIVETTTFFKHRRDCSDDKYYASIMHRYERGNSFVAECMGKDANKNCRYVFLPVFAYKNKNDYLTLAIHEVMHISKGKISKDKYQSGLLKRYMSKSEIGSTLHEEASGTKGDIQYVGNLFRGLTQSMQWYLFKQKRHKKLDNKVFYEAVKGDSEFEEALHHSQARKVAESIRADGLDSMLEMPYDMKLPGNTPISYEKADNVTKRFMEFFKEDFQKINSGEMSIESFKNKIGRKNYGLLSTLYQANNKKKSEQEEATYVAAVKLGQKNYGLLSTLHQANNKKRAQQADATYLAAVKLGEKDFRENQSDYDELGEEVVQNMKKRAERYSKKESLLNIRDDDNER